MPQAPEFRPREEPRITTLILVAGIALAVALAVAMTRPTLRLPALLLAMLSIPGNVDNIVPQMRMDPNAVANNTGPAISVVDLLIVWAVLLTLREGRRLLPGVSRRLLLGTLAFAVVVTLAATVAVLTREVEPLAALRGILTLARIPALVYLAIALFPLDPHALRLSVASALGAVALIGNGLYTSAVEEHVRFTAATFGRNGLGMVLVVTGLLAGGAAIQSLRGDLDRRLAIPLGVIAAAAIFGAVATGTRMALIALIVGVVGAVVLNRSWRSWRGVRQVLAGVAAVVLIVVTATFTTVAGSRTVSTVTEFGDTLDSVTNVDDEPEYSEIRWRARFWALAMEMASDAPLTGVGPYQWNILRYEYDPDSPRLVANPHNAYIQLAAEYGIPTMLAYCLLLLVVAGTVVATQFRARSTTAREWSAALLVGCAAAYPITELTNSHLLNVRLGAVGWVLLATALAIALADREQRRSQRAEATAGS